MTLELWSFTTGLGGAELRGMSVEALDGSIGTVEEVAEQPGGAYVVVDTGRWIFGKTVLLPAGVVRAVDYDRRCVFVGCSRDDVKNAPEHDPGAYDGGAREALGAYYGELRRRDDRAEQHSSRQPGSDPPATRPHAEPSPAPSPAGTGADIASPVQDTAARTGTASMPDVRAMHHDAGRTAAGGSDTASPDDDAERRTAGSAAPGAAPQVSGERKSSGDTQPPSSPAREASASPKDDGSGRPDEARPTRRFTGDSDGASSTAGTSGSSGRSSAGEGRTSSAQPPIARYDSLTAAEVIARLRNLSQRELATLERYEKRHHDRQTVLSRIDSLREDEPWRGYDDATVPEIRRTLADADEDRAKAVRDYERRHRDRKGVMDAARRIVASA